MTDRPIIFSAPMVLALLAGRKTQTRPILNSVRTFSLPESPARTLRGEELDRALQNASGMRRIDGDSWTWKADAFAWQAPATETSWFAHIGYAPGDRLYVQEAWSHDGPDLDTVRSRHEDALGGGIGYGPYYRATEVAPDTLSWRPSIHMPRWASRLTLVVTEVKVERLQDISEADAEAEGVTPICDHGVGNAHLHTIAFEQLWDRFHGEGAWLSNPWVCAISFTATPKNIDSLTPTDALTTGAGA